jgi:broad specificity phosphatase PhoE
MLLLVRHAMPTIDPDKPAKMWQLGAEGEAKSALLVPVFERYGVTRVITSEEPKAIRTGEVPATQLNLPCATAPNLHEHDRTNELFGSRDAFHEKVRRFFTHPDTLIFGEETAAQARDRFVGAVREQVATYPDDTLAIVAHGTVMTLLVAAHNENDIFTFWQSLIAPCMVVVDSGDFSLKDIITELE